MTSDFTYWVEACAMPSIFHHRGLAIVAYDLSKAPALTHTECKYTISNNRALPAFRPHLWCIWMPRRQRPRTLCWYHMAQTCSLCLCVRHQVYSPKFVQVSTSPPLSSITKLSQAQVPTTHNTKSTAAPPQTQNKAKGYNYFLLWSRC